MPRSQAMNSPKGNQFGMFGGVFTPSILTILGLILFMRANQILGNVGVLAAVAILLISKSITFLTSLSISAISTNMQVKGGGAYFLISRVLGPEFGGAIGIALFFALALSVPFYFLGFTEALVTTFPSLTPHFQKIAFAGLITFFIVAWVGASWAIKTQYVIMGILVSAIAAFMIGSAQAFSLSTFQANLHGAAPGELIGVGGEALIPLSFWAAFAIYFPAVTGIDAGVNMSGDLKDPARSIPKGTLLAVLVGLVVYLVQIGLGAGAFERGELVNRPFEILKDVAPFKLGFVVVGGAFAATLSSALGSLLGAPRVLQAVARDKIIGVLRPFAKGQGAGDEPRRAVVVTGIAGALVLLWAGNSAGGGALNAVASIITMFFLYSYGMINLAAFIEAASGNPSFRPRFRFFHWSTALAGALGSVVVAFLINPVAAIAAAVVLGGLVVYVQTRHLQTSFGDARRGFVFRRARQNLIQLMTMEKDRKNWRPTILVFSGNPSSRDTLVTYAVWLESGRGFVFLAQVLVGSLAEHANHRRMAVKRLREFCDQNKVQAFPAVVVADELERGIATLLQTAGIAPVRTNLVMFGWSLERSRVSHTAKHLRTACTLDQSVILLHDRGLPLPGPKKRIDVWWRGQQNGALMLTLAHLLSKNWEWVGSRIRVIRMVKDEFGLEPAKVALQKLMEAARVDAEAFTTIAAEGGFDQTLHQTSGDATCVLLGFEIPTDDEAEAWHERYTRMLAGLPTTLLVRVGEEAGAQLVE